MTSGVPIIEHSERQNLLQMSETQRVHKYNDLRALQMLLANENNEDVLAFLEQHRERAQTEEMLEILQ
jgi:hypothetical protein